MSEQKLSPMDLLNMLDETLLISAKSPDEAFEMVAERVFSNTPVRSKKSGTFSCINCDKEAAIYSSVADHTVHLTCPHTFTKVVSHSVERGLRLLKRGCLKKNSFHTECPDSQRFMRGFRCQS